MVMKNRENKVREETFFLASVILIVGVITLWFVDDEVTKAGYAIADCVDNDGDGYYNSNCALEDLGCPEETEYVFGDSNSVGVDADQDYIVYRDDSSGAWQVYMYDFVSSTLLSSSEGALNPRISEPYIVWQGYDSGLWQVYLYSLTSGTSSVLSAGTGNQVSPDVSSSYVVWSDNRNGEWDIYGYNFATGAEETIIADAGNQVSPKVYGNYLVYTDDSAGNQDVYLYDLSSGTKTQVSTSTEKDNAPDVSSNYVVWESYNSGSWDVYAYDIASGSTAVVAEGSSEQRLPKLSDDIIVWMDYDEIYYYDMSEGLTSKITSSGSQKRLPTVFGKMVYWLDYRNGNWDIYGKAANVACDLSYFGDCDDNDASITVCDEGLNGTEEANETVDFQCLSDIDCAMEETCSGGYCVVAAVSVDCSSQWDCSNVEWSSCESGMSTRDLSLCNVVPTDDECYLDDYLPESSKECVEDTGAYEAGNAEETEEVPVFTWVNLILVVSILIGFYYFKKF
jgi:beta propeller repeat protein